MGNEQDDTQEYLLAERSGQFLMEVLEEMNCNIHIYDTEPIRDLADLRKFPGHYGGLYLFYLKGGVGEEKRFPIYVGVTKQSFKDRFRDHAQEGVLRMAWDGCFPGGLEVYAVCTPYEGAAACRIKHILLHFFDFTLKSRRCCLDVTETYPAPWTKRRLSSFPWDELKRLAAEYEAEEEEKRKRAISSEQGGLFIRHLLDELNVNIGVYDKEEIRSREDLVKFPAHYGGLYLFYMKEDKDSDVRYPIYIGAAKSSFKDRFTRHANEVFNGILYKIWNGGFHFEGMGVYAVCTHYKGASAKVLKKFLLNTFDFPLKMNIRGDQRRELDEGEQLPVEYILNNYDIKWEECVEEVKRLAN